MNLMALVVGMLLRQDLGYSEEMYFGKPLWAAICLLLHVNSVAYNLASSETSQVVWHLHLGNISYLLEEEHIVNDRDFGPNEHYAVL